MSVAQYWFSLHRPRTNSFLKVTRYARTKVMAESYILKAYPDWVIVTSGVL